MKGNMNLQKAFAILESAGLKAVAEGRSYGIFVHNHGKYPTLSDEIIDDVAAEVAKLTGVHKRDAVSAVMENIDELEKAVANGSKEEFVEMVAGKAKRAVDDRYNKSAQRYADELEAIDPDALEDFEDDLAQFLGLEQDHYGNWIDPSVGSDSRSPSVWDHADGASYDEIVDELGTPKAYANSSKLFRRKRWGRN